MRKLYLFIATMALSVTTAMAQLPAMTPGNNAAAWTPAVQKTKTVASPVVTKGQLSAPQGLANAKMPAGLKSATRAVGGARSGARALASNQKYMGAYTSDTYLPATEGLSLYSLLGEGWFTVTAFLPASQIAKYDGGKITGVRFAFANSAFVDNVVVYTLGNDGIPVRLCGQSYVGDTKEGWNEVEFRDTNVKTIDLSNLVGLIIGFTYYQGNDENDPSTYPISMVREGNSSYFYVYGTPSTGNGGEGWYDLTSYVQEYGNLSVQAIVEKDDFAQNDPVMQGLVVTKDWYKRGSGEGVQYATALYNFGTSTIGDLVVGTAIDNVETSNTLSIKNLDGTAQTVTGTVDLPADIALGRHIISVYAKTADGQPLEHNTGDDGFYTYFYVYDNSVARQKNLVEEFTSQYSPYAQLATTSLDNLAASCNGDIARVAVHADLSTEQQDEFYNNYTDSLIFLTQAAYCPSAAFNRTMQSTGQVAIDLVTDNDGTPTAYDTSVLNEVVTSTNNNPALATVNIGGTYDAATRKLDVKVSGEGVDVDEVLPGYGLTVLLTEDGVQAQQMDIDGNMQAAYTHDNVLRKALTKCIGSAINWNGNTYEQSFSLTLDEAWNADNMNIVAFIAPIPEMNENLDYTHGWVTNANSIKLSSISTGISGVAANGSDAVETARYNAAGQAVSAPVKGINIIKMSNGETRKVVVR